MRCELTYVAGHRRFEAGRRDCATDRAARDIESPDELEPLVAENVCELRQRNSGLHGDAIAVDLEHAIHFREIELGAAARGDATRHRARRADGPYGAWIAPRVHQDLTDLGRRR